MKKKDLIILSSIFLLITCLPYAVAEWAGNPDYVFGGFLINPQDGHSYLAKMYQGWLGHWKAVLPYTADTGEGAYIFLYYLFLGHIARITNLSLLITYHLARAIGALILLLSMARFFKHLFGDQEKSRWAVLLAAFGSGIGWLVLPFGRFTSDFWVAEAYPFLSAFVNPHFPLALALILWLLTGYKASGFKLMPAFYLFGSLLLAIIQPFGVVIVFLVLFVKAVWDYCDAHQASWVYPALVGLGSAPVLVYQEWLVHQDPLWLSWNAQNLTPTPPPWDLLLAFSPALVFAVLGMITIIRARDSRSRILVCWFVICLLLLYFPFNLQRRFMLGLFIPVVGLAVEGIHLTVSRSLLRTHWLPAAIFCSSILTNLILLFGMGSAMQNHQPALYLTKNLSDSMAWIRQNTPQNALVLSTAEIGLWIPSFTGRRVIYGHPFETVNASAEKQLVEDFFSNAMDANQGKQLIIERQVDYILYDAYSDESPSRPMILDSLKVLYQVGNVQIFQTR